MYQLISDILWKIIKPIGISVVKKKGYPEEAASRKCGIIPEEGFSKDDQVIMFHGVSVGEALALENLVKTARKEFPSSKIVMTTGTYTGQEIAKKKLGESTDLITYFPADFPCVIKKFLDKVNPKTVFIAETEIWPNFAMECKKRGINLYIINGRISDSTFKSYNALKWIFKYFLSFYTGIFTQSEDDNNKFLKLGANPQTTKVMNNLKFDIKRPEGIVFDKNGARVLLAGSTHAGEDEIVLSVFKKLKEKHSDLKLILAPRHLTRVEEVVSLIKSIKGKYPILGLGLGAQLIAYSYGSTVNKMKHGHQGANIPVKNISNGIDKALIFVRKLSIFIIEYAESLIIISPVCVS